MSNLSRPHISLPSILFVMSALLVGLAWWLLQLSECAGSLKQGLGDYEKALALESLAFMAHFVGILFLTFCASVARPIPSKWLQLGAWFAFLPFTYLTFLVLSFSTLGNTWACTL
jgi:hypothetical protein